MDLRVKPEDDKENKRPKMTKLLLPCHSRESGNPGVLKSL